MNGFRILLLSYTLFFGIDRLSGQTLNGNWFGIGKVRMEGDYSSYLGELVLKQKGKKITGQFQYYFRDSLFTTPVSGSFDVGTRKLTLNPVAIIYFQSPTTRNGIDCYMTGNFTLRTSRNESVLTGFFTSDEAHRYTVPDMDFRFRFSADTAALVVKDEEDEPAVTHTMRMTTPPAISVTSQPIPLIPSPDSMALSLRPKVYLKEISVTGPSLRLELYDNGTVDYDSVSLYFNGKLILPKTKLSHKAIRLTIQLNDSLETNEISMFAENLGMIPPNTAALIVYDGKIRHEAVLSSDLNKTGTIRLKNLKIR